MGRTLISMGSAPAEKWWALSGCVLVHGGCWMSYATARAMGPMGDDLKEGIATWNTPVLEAAAARKLGGQKRTSWEQFLQTQFSDSADNSSKWMAGPCDL